MTYTINKANVLVVACLGVLFALFLWNQENDSRTWTAPSLRHYLEGWLGGRLKVGGREV